MLTVEKPLAAGPATVHITYTGILNDEMRGLYLGKDDQGRKYAASQFEATDARRAFPSFDEPDYKATFDITAVADKSLVAISNQKIVSDTAGPGDKHTVRFATTAKMSSYLAALVVGNFEYIEGEADGIPIRVYARRERKRWASSPWNPPNTFSATTTNISGSSIPMESWTWSACPTSPRAQWKIPAASPSAR